MALLKGATFSCPSSHSCSNWARVYLSYCLCSAKDGAALILGMVSVISWGIAEVPQIITNYKKKSNEGLSITFLLAWTVGDLFNLVGCQLEPDTLPTQFYVALLYTVTTVILTGQAIYYGHIYPWLREKKSITSSKSEKQQMGDSLTHEHRPSAPIPVAQQVLPRWNSYGRDFYYMSARSLSKSPILTAGTWSAYSHVNVRAPPSTNNQLSAREPLLDRPDQVISTSSSNPKNILSAVPTAAFFLGICILHLFMNSTPSIPSDGIVISVGRKLLQDAGYDDKKSKIGTLLGWAMAIIYMAGRLPQICLNIRRGDVQGLNPLMFIFALTGNTTYVGSILAKSLDWSKLKPNLPWLVDAGGCVLLDGFILIQFAYFRLRKNKSIDD